MKKNTKLTGILAALTLIFALGACANGAEDTNNPEPKMRIKEKKYWKKPLLQQRLKTSKV